MRCLRNAATRLHLFSRLYLFIVPLKTMHVYSPQAPLRALVPIDLTVPPSTWVVAVTGPNTGGKTASLKTLGLLALMAKAGMYLPVAETADGVQIAWFDKVRRLTGYTF